MAWHRRDGCLCSTQRELPNCTEREYFDLLFVMPFGGQESLRIAAEFGPDCDVLAIQIATSRYSASNLFKHYDMAALTAVF
jgi:hypothetical protein